MTWPPPKNKSTAIVFGQGVSLPKYNVIMNTKESKYEKTGTVGGGDGRYMYERGGFAVLGSGADPVWEVI